MGFLYLKNETVYGALALIMQVEDTNVFCAKFCYLATKKESSAKHKYAHLSEVPL